ncbi:phage tail protein [Brucella sp. 21LCYQ03]|nr:phage tail protein [Brucella sp. 21LCYQ03]
MFHPVNFGYKDLRRDLSTKWASVNTVGGLNRLQWTGGDEDTTSIEGVLFPHEFGGLSCFGGAARCRFIGHGAAHDQSRLSKIHRNNP